MRSFLFFVIQIFFVTQLYSKSKDSLICQNSLSVSFSKGETFILNDLKKYKPLYLAPLKINYLCIEYNRWIKKSFAISSTLSITQRGNNWVNYPIHFSDKYGTKTTYENFKTYYDIAQIGFKPTVKINIWNKLSISCATGFGINILIKEHRSQFYYYTRDNDLEYRIESISNIILVYRIKNLNFGFKSDYSLRVFKSKSKNVGLPIRNFAWGNGLVLGYCF